MKKLLAMLAITVSSSSFAGLPEMMKIYNNPSSAPKVAACKGNVYCNGFIALSKQWSSIPDNYRHAGTYDIKKESKKNITYNDNGSNRGLLNGYYFMKDRTNDFINGAETYIDTKGELPPLYEHSLAVLLYIEDKNGWGAKY